MGGGFAAAQPFGEQICDLYKCLGDFVCRFLGFQVFCVNSGFEIVPRHISGPPFCSMSMEASEMMEKYSKNLVCCKLAKSGGVLYIIKLSQQDPN